MDKQVDFLVKLRDASLMLAEAANQYIDELAPAGCKQGETKQSLIIQESNFNVLKFETQQSAKLGEYEVAYKQGNPADKWSSVYNILKGGNATIQDRYYCEGYQYSYWLYGEDKIYRQKLKPKTQS
ncbi:MAG: hypothetical protein M1490_04890 [Candidatus Bathyarchaeota archaeon]|nr:hypothetical protein [Candidatus Bathyarchaeota archaeon]